ncbi:MAG: helicase-associated domain-containing protein [Verrucomicrobia bacterium]|nr:helicase-associated domain-containing protein [Verrucomicrobiota bacterium]
MNLSATPDPNNPLIVQGDHTVLLEVDNPLYPCARDALVRFAELVKSPEHIHTYRLTPLSIWNACAIGETAETIADTLRRYSKYSIPQHIEASVSDFAGRYGCLQLIRHSSGLLLRARDLPLAEELSRRESLRPFLGERTAPLEFLVPDAERGRLKHALIKIGFPTEDLAGYLEGETFPFDFHLRTATLDGVPFSPRDYQWEAADLFHAGGESRGGSGVIVLPCGAGKTIIGAVCVSRLQSSTLILVTNVTAALQWKQELLDKTSIPAEAVGLYSGNTKEIRPVTIATYQVLTHRKRKDEAFTHFRIFDERNWGLIIYDEVHLLPAPVFQVTAALQARRRLGRTATLVREDDVFALIGPKNQVSGMFGSRQEEAQRLGRILRPKPGENQAHFYSIVSRDTVEQDFAMNRQLFLCEQGYEYRILPLERPEADLPEFE